MFHGSIVALVTPMDGHGRIDYLSLRRLVDFHLDAGTNGIVVSGTTGESPTLTDDEYAGLLSRVIEQAGSAASVLAGTGGADTASVIVRTRLAEDLGADGALVVTPYYNRPMQSGLLAHFNTLADNTGLPLVIYNVPSRTAVDILPETVAELARRDDIVAIKEALPDLERIGKLVDLCGDSITILSGDDRSCCAALQAGAKGVVSVAANVVPARFREMCRRAKREDWAGVLEIDRDLRHLYDLLAFETNPIPVKWVLNRMALIKNGIRLPLLPLHESYHEKMNHGLAQLGLV